MKKLSRNLILMGTSLTSLCLSSCNLDKPEIFIEINDPNKKSPLYDGTQIEVSKVKTLDNGKTILYVEDKPFTYIGTQIRTDALMNTDKLSIEDLEVFFKAAKELGVSVVQVPLEWKDIEVDDNTWDFNYLKSILDYVNKYELKCELLWFGTNMCGDTHSYSVPEYILKDGKTYPKLDANKTGEFWNYYGVQWYMDFSNENLLEKEGRAITKSLDYVYEYDSTHDGKKPVIGIQILNEPDIFIRFRLDANEVISKSTLEKMSYEEAWDKVLIALDSYGKAAKQSKYKVYTRVNLAASTGTDYSGYYGIWDSSKAKMPPSWAKDIFALEGIDCIGDDSYSSSVRDIKGISTMYGENLPGNFSHIAENAGNYSNTASLILSSFSVGAGYNIYDLATPPFYIAHGSSSVDQGIYTYSNGTLTPRSHKDEVTNIINGLLKAGDAATSFDKGNFIGLNINGDNPSTNVNQTINSNNLTINFTTSSGSFGFAIDMGSYLVVYVTNDADLNLSNCNVSSVSKGYFAFSEFIKESSLEASSSIFLKGNTLYKIDYSSSSRLNSTAWNYIG